MGDLFGAVIAAADFSLNIVTSSIFKDLGSTDIRDYESEAEILALSVEYITGKLYNVDEQKITPVQKRAFEKLRVVVLDAEDILDKVETLIKKKKLKEVDDMVKRETNRKKRRLSIYSPIEAFANKASDVFSIIKKSDEVQDAITELNEKLEVVKIHLKEFEFPELSSRELTCNMSARASGSQVNAEKIMGRDEDKTEIIKLLSSCSINKDSIPVVSVVGMGGMGKTTMAQLVYHDKSWQEDFHFDLLLWVPDSKQLDLRSLLKSILKCIKPSDTSLDSLEETHLKDRLVEEIRDKRFFLVLDDVENESRLSWGNLEDLLIEGNMEGSRVLVTTRSRTVAVAMGSSDSTYPLKGLSEEDSLQLFERCAFEGRRDENLVEIGKLIVKKCGGVPLALKVIGSLLFDEKDKRKWERVRDRGLAQDNQLMPILKMSFDDLDSVSKQCFSYCALFPKNYRISKEKLSWIWMANVRFRTDKDETLNDICDEKFKLLFSRCFLELAEREIGDDAYDTYYKMHDLMHDLAVKVVGAEMVVADFKSPVDSDMLIIKENVRHLFLMSSCTLELKGRRLRTFAGGWESNDLNAENLVSSCPFLRFLDLRNHKIGNLTNSIGELIHLRYLYLSGGGFQTLDSITKLINLQHLTLESCKDMTHLPSEMGALISLEVLHISNCGKLKELPKEIQRLANLRCLKLKWCGTLTRLPSEMGALTSLEVLDVSCGYFNELPTGIEKLTNLKCLLLYSCTQLTNIPSKMGGLISLEVLDISNCYELKELPIGIEKLTNLKDLNLEGCSGLTQMPSGMGALLAVCRPTRLIIGHPESQHTAQLEDLAYVSELKHGELEIQLPYTSETLARDGDRYLVNTNGMRKLEIEWKKYLDPIITEEEEEVPTNHMDILAKLQPPINLEEFILNGYQGITFPAWVPKDAFASILPNLVKIHIMWCNRCRHLPALSRLTSLKCMELQCLSSLEYIEEDVLGTSFFPSLEELVLQRLPKLKGWCRGGGLTTCTAEQEQLMMLPLFPRLLKLEISKCPNLKVEPILVSFIKVFSVKSHLVEKREETMSSSGTPLALSSSSLSSFVQICTSGGHFCLSMKENSLQFVISYCSGLKTLTGLQHLTALQQLSIRYCRDFTGEEDEATCSQDAENQSKCLQSLQRLSLWGLPNMKGLPNGIQFLTSLKELNITNCDNLAVPEWVHNTFKRVNIAHGVQYQRVNNN